MLKVNGGTVTINGVSYSGQVVVIDSKGKVTIDGKSAEGPDSLTLTVTVTGNPELVKLYSGTLRVKGDVGSVETVSGDVNCGKVLGDVSTISGDVECAGVAGNVKTISGDVYQTGAEV